MTGPQTRRRLGLGAVGLLSGLLLALVLWSLVSTLILVSAIRHQQTTNAPILESTNHAATSSDRSLRLVKSCVSPAGSCYKRGQAQTATAVGSINEVVLLAAACAIDKHGTIGPVQREIERCIKERLHDATRGTK